MMTRVIGVRSAILMLLIGILSSTASFADTCGQPDSSADYQLVFDESFDGDSLDPGTWNKQLLWGPGVIINNETQYYVNDGQFGYEPFKVADGVLSIEAIKAPFDRSQLYLTRSIYSADTVELLWRVPESAVRYDIYRDGLYQASVNGGSFLQSGLRDGIDYAYEVRALNDASAVIVSAQLTVNTADRPMPVADRAFGLYLAAKIYSSDSAELIWQAPNRAGSYRIYRNGDLYRSLAGGDFKSLYEAGLQADQQYRYRVEAYDRCDELIISEELLINTASGSQSADEQVSRLVIRATEYSRFTAEIAWNAVSGARRYEVLDNSVAVQNSDARSWFIGDLLPGVDRKFRVIAYDSDGAVLDETSRVINTADNSFALNRQPYLSGVITSYDAFRFRYGRVEARARMPAGKGLWSAFWLLNAYYKQDQPADPEIDIIEAIGDRTTTGNQAYHYQADFDGDGIHDNQVSTELRSVISDFSADFHVYRVDWEPGRIVWYIDDVETHRIEGAQVSDEQMYLIANLAVGGTFPGPADETTVFPARYEIDYIKVYQRPSLN